MQSRRPPCVLAIHDLCVTGRCALSVVSPVLSARGVRCCPLPSALLSATANVKGGTMLDLTDEMGEILRHLGTVGIDFDAVYSGYLANPAQAALVQAAFDAHPNALRVVDPVLGDHGKLYRTMDDSMADAMRRLASKANLITPNVTEAALLLGYDPARTPSDENEARSWLEELTSNGSRDVVLTGLSFDNPNELTVGWAKGRQCGLLRHPRTGGAYAGTGDIFTSFMLADMLHGSAVETAASAAIGFMICCVEHTAHHHAPPEDGLWFETVLRNW